MHLMKKITITLLLPLFIAACSSGNTISDVPQNVTSVFQGSFQDASGSGTLTLNLSDNGAGVVTGNIIVSGNSCLLNGSFTDGVSNGFNVTINGIEQAGQGMFQVVTTTTSPDTTDAAGMTVAGEVISVTTVVQPTGTVGTQQSVASNGNTVETVTTALDGAMGTLSLQLAVTNGGNTLSGTFVSEGDVCPAGQGSGSIVLNA